MRFIHASGYSSAAVTVFTGPEGWEHLLVVLKAAYTLPENGRTPELLPPPPLAVRDEFAGPPGLSAPLYENDFAPRKARCDVIFKARAHAPDGRPVKRLDVAVQVGALRKALHVVGDRYWEKDVLHARPSEPRPFVSLPLHYGLAFGGRRAYGGQEQFDDCRRANPVGTGYSGRRDFSSPHGLKLPNLETPGRPLRRPDEDYPAVALSPLARNFHPRHTYAGTYDQPWKENLAPLWPPDFDERFFQCAPEDQRIDYPQGGEPVRLVNLAPGRPEIYFDLPDLGSRPVRVLHNNLAHRELEARPDTLFFEPDEGRFSVTWRADLPLGHKGPHDLRLVAADELCPLWWAEMRRGAPGCAGCAAFDPEALPPGCPHQPQAPAIDPARAAAAAPPGEARP